ncbi:MAG: IS3 family transposase [Bacteroidota bacterium]
MSKGNLRLLVEPSSDLSIVHQCELLGLSRSSYYYEPAIESPENLKYMQLMDQQYLETPYYGVGQMTYHLKNLGYAVNIKRIRRLYRLMGLRAICPGPHTSKPAKGTDHQILPYLLRGMVIDRVGQVVGTDITYIPMKGGFMYLVAFLDWYSRYVLSWELSNSLETVFCLSALDGIWEQLKVEIINTDQGSQFTSLAFIQAVKDGGATQSMDGKGRAIDNVFTERLWRSLKYEEVYIKSYENGTRAWQSLKRYFYRYNHLRPNKHLGGKPPIEVFNGNFKAPKIYMP